LDSAATSGPKIDVRLSAGAVRDVAVVEPDDDEGARVARTIAARPIDSERQRQAALARCGIGIGSAVTSAALRQIARVLRAIGEAVDDDGALSHQPAGDGEQAVRL
jgi:hypothetical protein